VEPGGRGSPSRNAARVHRYARQETLLPPARPAIVEYAPVEGEATAELGNLPRRSRDNPDGALFVRRRRFVSTRIAAGQYSRHSFQLVFDPVDSPHSAVAGGPHHSARWLPAAGFLTRALLDEGSRSRIYAIGWMVRELIDTRRPPLRDTGIADRGTSGQGRPRRERSPKRYGGLRRWAAGKRRPNEIVISQDSARPRLPPRPPNTLSLRRITMPPPNRHHRCLVG